MDWNWYYKTATSRLRKANLSYSQGTISAEQEARWLITWLNKKHYKDFRLISKHTPDRDKLQQFNKLLARRITTHTPLAYLLGESWFWGRRYVIDRRALIPRSPIGEVIVKGRLPKLTGYRPTTILDIGTGSGCLAIAAAYKFPDAKVVASDVSRQALNIAKINVKNHTLNNRVQLVVSDCFENIKPQKFDCIIANPPYVSVREYQKLPRSLYYEPESALICKIDDMHLVSKIISKAKKYLTDDGILLLEVGNRIKDVKRLFPWLKYQEVPLKNGGEGVLLIHSKNLKCKNLK